METPSIMCQCLVLPKLKHDTDCLSEWLLYMKNNECRIIIR